MRGENPDILDIINNGNLTGVNPEEMLLHGPTKRYVDAYHWHSPNKGIIASYTPTAADVLDHFGLFRGVDQVEAFAQATACSIGTFLECRKLNCTPSQLMEKYIPSFISIGRVGFHSYLKEGDKIICMGITTFFKWRQTVCDGRIYKAPEDLDLDAYFSGFTDERLLNYDISKDFVLVADLSEITGRALPVDLFNKNE